MDQEQTNRLVVNSNKPLKWGIPSMSFRVGDNEINRIYDSNQNVATKVLNYFSSCTSFDFGNFEESLNFFNRLKSNHKVRNPNIIP